VGIRTLVISLLVLQVGIALVNLSPIIDSSVGEILDVDEEATAIVWLSSTLLSTIAILGIYAGAANWSVGAPRRSWMGWLVIAAGFLLLSIDETSQLHERAGEKFSDLVQIPALPGSYGWVAVVAPAALVGAVWMLKWLGETVGFGTPTTRLATMAVGLWVLVPVLEAFDPTLGGPRLLIVAEETFETVGTTLFLAGVLIHLRDRGWLQLPASEPLEGP
jgi:hypothetical protein